MRQLADVCRREGVSRAEIIRRAVADYLGARHVRDGDDVSASGETATSMACSTSAAAGANGRDVRALIAKCRR